MELKLSDADKISIIKQIINHDLFLGDYRNEEGGVITFLEMIWDLRSMDSNDSRFSNARDDIWQHIVRNDDISLQQLFLDRLPSTYNNNDTFIRFVNTSVHPSVLSDNSDRIKFVSDLNRILDAFKLKLVIQSYFGEIPVYSITDNLSILSMPEGIPLNTIPFYFNNENLTYPCFKLVSDNWNDWYKWVTNFQLRYYKSTYDFYEIGTLKIMSTNTDTTAKSLPPFFELLEDNFCSIGQSREYYENLKKFFPQECNSILLALRDAALYPSIHALFSKDAIFQNSLLRENEAKQMLDSARFIINNIDISSYYKFSYSFIPPYTIDNENVINIDFDFVYNSEFNQRIFGLIGKNGTGKTTFLSRMANDFAKVHPQTIIPQKPVYNKVITISFSFFDKLPLPQSNAEFNYTYLGLRGENEHGNVSEILENKLITSLHLIKDLHREHIWYSFIKKILHEDLHREFVEGTGIYANIKIDSIIRNFDKFSSGENLLLYIITSLIAEIDNSTLILFDEPENHLHPNAISQLMNALYKLTAEFNSFCIIATHSPIVIQEIPSKNVKIFRRNDSILEINSITYETFAENLTTITNDIFGNREIAKYHYNILEEIIEKTSRNTYEEIIQLIQNNNIPVALNTRLLINDLLDKHMNEKS